jgi:hypothetical protein
MKQLVLIVILLILAASAQDKAKPAFGRCTDNTPLCTAKSIRVESHTGYMKREQLEAALQKHPELGPWGLELTRDAKKAELTIQVTRAHFQTKFPFSVVAKDQTIVFAGEVDSIGGTVFEKVAKQVLEKMEKK